MSCKYCEHETVAYRTWRDPQGRMQSEKLAESMPFEVDYGFDPEPTISWDGRPWLCVTAYDVDGCEACISIPIRFCPMCGRELPKSEPGEVVS